jgi:geranylgeranyl pyrophosphate synthase
MSLIQTGQIEAIVGISCLSVLERTFPYIEAAAIPAIAVPLLQDDCIDTTVDIDWVWDYIHLTAADTTHRLNLNTLHDEVKTWHNPTHLQNLQASPLPTTQQQANQWLLQDGKRWRPFLLTATYQALRPHTHHTPIPPHIQQAALAIEFFHKASLAHDDIEDHDTLRNGHPTLNHTHGLEIALNLGDCMIGEGYRLLATLPISPSQAQPILRIAAESQLELSHGQGAELLWQRQKTILTPSQTATIFRQKTSPAFRAAILIGAALTDTLPQFEAALSIYSDHLGIAYQIHDDLQDWKNDLQPQKLWTNSIVLAHLLEKATATQQQRWLEGKLSITELSTQQIQQALEKSQLLMESHKQAAIQALQDLENPNLKGLLRRIIGKIFNELEIKGWCNEIQHEKINETRRQEAAHEAAHLQPNLS